MDGGFFMVMAMKIAIFIDGGYLDTIAKRCGVKIDYCKLSVDVSQGKEEKTRFSNAQKFHQALERLPRYEVRTGRLVRRGDEYEQKGVDTLLSIDLVNLAASGKISDAVLVAGDSDFMPAVKVAKDLEG
jgi:uncharacterized LabA/DUF88 family protein